MSHGRHQVVKSRKLLSILAVAPQMQLPPAVVGPPKTMPTPPSPPPPPPSVSDQARPADSAAVDPELVSHIKSAVIAKLGTTEHNGLLDKIIPQILARLNK